MNETKEEQNVLENQDFTAQSATQKSGSTNSIEEKTSVKRPAVRKRAAKKSIKEEQLIQIKDPDETEQDIVLSTDQQKENVLSESDQEAAGEESEQGETEQKFNLITDEQQNENVLSESDHEAAGEETEYKFVYITDVMQKEGLQSETDQEAGVFSEHIQSAIENTAEKESKKNKKKKLDPMKCTLCKLVKKDYLKKHIKEYQDLIIDPKYICTKCGRGAHNKKSLCKPQKIE